MRLKPSAHPRPIRRRPLGRGVVVAAALLGCQPSSQSEASSQGSEAQAVDTTDALIWTAAPSLPRPVANNAVVGTQVEGESHVYSFLGVDDTKQWDGVVSWAFRWTVGTEAWEELPPVPGPGRLAATAESVGGKIYVFGGYTVASDGAEASLPNVDIFEPVTETWSSGVPIPVPVDDAVSGVWRDSLIVLVSGWHDTDNVADVQIYDPGSDSWASATPVPGPPVFGHAGGVVGDRVIYLGGANTGGSAPRYRIEGSAWAGDIRAVPALNEVSVEWRSLSRHPGPLRYRAAAGRLGPWMLFAGGTDNPYNYDGVGYNGVRSEALTEVFAFHGPSGRWVEGPPLPAPRMDHRALAVAGGVLALAGGMDGAGDVTGTVFIADALAMSEALTANAR